MGWTPQQVFILLFLLLAYGAVFSIFIINGGEKMFNWLITMFAPMKTTPKRCVDCTFMGVLRSCGREYCKQGRRLHDSPDTCSGYVRGENPINRGEI